MSTSKSRTEYKASQTIIAVVYLLLMGFLGMATAVAETDTRVSGSSHYSEGGRSKTQEPSESVDIYGTLETEGVRGKSPGAVNTAKTGSGATVNRAASLDFWFYSADVVLFGDDDLDGYFFGIDLLFDADTAWSAADVYAVTYLSLESGPWNEYAVTDDFTLLSTSVDDEYNIVTELETGYPAASYDLLIELFDAQTGEYLAGFGPEETSELGFLPLEDFNRDAPIIVIADNSHSHSHGGGGAIGVSMLLMLLIASGLRRGRQSWQ
jgi:hypothetical protein